MLDHKMVLENAMKCWKRYFETGDQMYYDRAIGLLGTCWRLVK